MNIQAVIVSVAKFESDYIEEWVCYHLGLGFKHIYLYDNEDEPTYNNILKSFSKQVTVIHIPYNNEKKPIQFRILKDFKKNHMYTNNNTHCIHMDIDEFICLKKHSCINNFIEEYIKGSSYGIGINWKFFGSSGHVKKSSDPVTQRFTKCQQGGNCHLKTLYSIEHVNCLGIHNVSYKDNLGWTHSTDGNKIPKAFNRGKIDLSIIQLNHYKCKTWEEYKYTITRGRANVSENEQPIYDLKESFDSDDKNEEEDLTAKLFYQNLLRENKDYVVKELPTADSCFSSQEANLEEPKVEEKEKEAENLIVVKKNSKKSRQRVVTKAEKLIMVKNKSEKSQQRVSEKVKKEDKKRLWDKIRACVEKRQRRHSRK